MLKQEIYVTPEETAYYLKNVFDTINKYNELLSRIKSDCKLYHTYQIAEQNFKNGDYRTADEQLNEVLDRV